MNKYEGLTDFLNHQLVDEIEITFEDMEDVDKIGITLPDSAKQYRQWWENQGTPNGRQCRAWLDAGWEVAFVDFAAERVTFRRRQNQV